MIACMDEGAAVAMLIHLEESDCLPLSERVREFYRVETFSGSPLPFGTWLRLAARIVRKSSLKDKTKDHQMDAWRFSCLVLEWCIYIAKPTSQHMSYFDLEDSDLPHIKARAQ